MSIEGIVNQKEKPAYVSFVRAAVEDKAKSREAGHYVGRDVDFVHITPAYTKDIIVSKVSNWFPKLEMDVRNERIPQEWVDHYRKQYQAWQNGQELPLNGTAIKGWGVLSPSQQQMLIDINIRTVEDLAGVNDEGIRRIGMGAVDLKNKARAWLAQLKDKGPLTQEMAAVQAKNRELETQVEALTRQVQALMKDVQKPEVKDTPAAEVPISASDLLAEPTREDLEAAYLEKFGKPAHHRMKDSSIAEALKG